LELVHQSGQQSALDQELRALEKNCLDALRKRGWQSDYIAVRKRSDLREPSLSDLQQKRELVILAAAKLGKTRLIDNLEV